MTESNTKKSEAAFAVGDTVYIINKLFTIHEVVVVGVVKDNHGNLIPKVNYQNGTGDVFAVDEKVVLATAENYDHLVAIFGFNAFVFPNQLTEKPA